MGEIYNPKSRSAGTIVLVLLTSSIKEQRKISSAIANL